MRREGRQRGREWRGRQRFYPNTHLMQVCRMDLFVIKANLDNHVQTASTIQNMMIEPYKAKNMDAVIALRYIERYAVTKTWMRPARAA